MVLGQFLHAKLQWGFVKMLVNLLKQCYYSHILDQFEFSYLGVVVVFVIRSIRKIGDWVWTEKQQRVSHSLSCEDSVIKIGRKTSDNSCLYFSHSVTC